MRALAADCQTYIHERNTCHLLNVQVDLIIIESPRSVVLGGTSVVDSKRLKLPYVIDAILLEKLAKLSSMLVRKYHLPMQHPRCQSTDSDHSNCL
ncbi:hypothetical protein PILCRDRAFT_545784 [Piloderma croceum F 1598]|uniref:Uncharacterized protein n=1 Tax=Piloderma croceum (strain F 1598) TaxID=765440 RepID=A0A0C3B0Q5_PILCF|nr:hypothetical protein PILCRDRAFT_545784 [Piloderma croceum F 1598]